MRVADLFAGLGGFSAGALAAGAQVVLGVDHDPVPLKLWSANVRGARAVLATLGTGQELTELPPPSPSLHVHAGCWLSTHLRIPTASRLPPSTLPNLVRRSLASASSPGRRL